MGPGGWWGFGFRRYVDLEMDRAFRISRALIALSISDALDQGALPEGGGCGVAPPQMAAYPF